MRKGPSKIDPEFTIGRAWIQARIELLNKESYLFNTRCFPPPVFSCTPNLDLFGGIEKSSKLGVIVLGRGYSRWHPFEPYNISCVNNYHVLILYLALILYAVLILYHVLILYYGGW